MSEQMTVKEVAARLRVSDGLVRDEIRRGHLRATKVGTIYRISEQQLQAYINRVEPLRDERQQRTQRLSAAPEPNWTAAICQPRKRSKAG